MALDSIVTLAAAMAETPSTVLVAGAGVSRDAGVPTAWDIELIVLRKLYEQDSEGRQAPTSDEEVVQWRDSVDALRGGGYSKVLEAFFVEPATRRDFLAKQFEGREPGDSHREIARLVADGYVQIVVTTNFDRLLEDALRDVGITPTVVTTTEELRRRGPREQVRGCFLLKVHGDYLESTIRNTADELARPLELEIRRELAPIFERHNIVAVGYAGRDPAIIKALRDRRIRRVRSSSPSSGRVR